MLRLSDDGRGGAVHGVLREEARSRPSGVRALVQRASCFSLRAIFYHVCSEVLPPFLIIIYFDFIIN
jgi:hypothetical protein